MNIPAARDIPPDGTPPGPHKVKPRTPPVALGPDLNAPGTAGDTTTKDTSTKKDDSTTPTPTPPASAADIGFSAGTPQYSIKLVYLPDYSHPLALSMHSGVFGTASIAPALQDGWMLTSLQANGDNKVAETLTAVAAIIAGTHGGGAAAGTGKDKGGTPGGAPGTTEITDPIGEIISSSKVILRPGLYRFEYGTDGRLSGLCAVAFFSRDGALKPTDSKGDPIACIDSSPLDATKSAAKVP